VEISLSSFLYYKAHTLSALVLLVPANPASVYFDFLPLQD